MECRTEADGPPGMADRDSVGDLSEIRDECRADVQVEAQPRPRVQGVGGDGAEEPLQPGHAPQCFGDAGAGGVLCGVVSQKQNTTCPKLSGAAHG